MPTGSRIKEIRKQKGLTQKQLGDLCGMADSAIRRYENGKANPKIETLQKIATALKCNLSDLMDADEYKLHNIEIAIKKVNDSVLEKNKEIDNEPMTIAAHFDGDECTDEKDIAKDMENIRQKIMNGADGPLSYDGKPIPKEDTELLLGQIELMMRRLKPINKEKYNPNKNKQ